MALNGLQMPFSALQGISDLHHVGLDGTEGEVLSRRHSRASYMANQSIYIEYIRVNISVSPCIHHIRGVKVTLSIDAKLASKQLLAPSPATNLSDAT